jgi:hypothetical protein
VRLRVEEHLGVAHPLRGRPAQVSQAELVEVAFGHEHGARAVIDVEERLQVAEAVGEAHALDVGVRQGDVVAPGHLEHELGLQRPLNVDVQLRLGDGPGEGEGIGWRVGHPAIRLRRSAGAGAF